MSILWDDVLAMVKCRIVTCDYIQNETEQGCFNCPCEECCKSQEKIYRLIYKSHGVYEWWNDESF